MFGPDESPAGPRLLLPHPAGLRLKKKRVLNVFLFRYLFKDRVVGKRKRLFCCWRVLFQANALFLLFGSFFLLSPPPPFLLKVPAFQQLAFFCLHKKKNFRLNTNDFGYFFGTLYYDLTVGLT